jgi:HlyD family secretion protein
VAEEIRYIGTVKKPKRPKRSRAARWAAFLVFLAAVVIGSIAWATASFVRTAREVASVDKLVVQPRTFAVVLKEKGELKASKSTDIKSEVEGRSTIITLVAEGTAVKEGDLLVELASDQIDDRIRQEELKETNAITAYEAAKSELEIQRDKNASDVRKSDLQIELYELALKRYQEGEWGQQLRDAQIAIEQAEVSIQRRLEDFEASKQLREHNFITKTEYDESEFNYKRAQWELEKAQLALEVLKKYTNVAELRQRESDLEEARKESERVRKNAAAEETKRLRTLEGAEKELSIIREQLAKLRTQKMKCRIVAPTQGFVVYFSGDGGRFMSQDTQIKEGAEVFERQVLLQLPDTTEMMIVVRVHEAKTDKLRVGQRVEAEIEGVPGRRFTGKVNKIAVLADTQNRWLNPDLKEYETEILLDKTDVPLKPGVTAHVEIFVETVEDRLAVPVQSVYSKGGRRYVFREKAGVFEPVEVRLGAVSTEWVEVVEGVAESDRIALSATEDQKRLLPDVRMPEGSRDAAPGSRRNVGGDGPRRRMPPGGGTGGMREGAPPRREGEADRRPARNENEKSSGDAKPATDSTKPARPAGSS